MNFPGLLFVLAAHFLAGRGLLSIFRIRQRMAVTVLLSVITGIVLVSLVPFLLQLLRVPITTMSVVTGICTLVLALNITEVRRYDYSVLKPRLPRRMPPLYDLMFIVTIIILMVPSVWYCFFFPPYARDMLSGPEPMAELAIKQHTFINDIFTVNLEGTNNHIKPPFVLGLQIVYKMLVHPFGQLWVNIMALSFIAWIYLLLRDKLHPMLAGILMLFFICAPDVYAYTYIMLFDYSNMVLFFTAVYFLSVYFSTGQHNHFLFSAMLFGLATCIRSETLVLAALFVPVLFFHFIRQKIKPVRIVINMAVFMAIPFVCYYTWIGIFLKYYMPERFDVAGEINHHLSDLSPFFNRLNGMNSQLIFGGVNIDVFGLIFFLFLAVLLTDVLFYRKFNTEAKLMLYTVLTVYFGLALLGYLIPWVDLMNTTKRGLFKCIPPMLIYMRNSGSLTALSQWLRSVELPQAKQLVVPVQQKAAEKKKGHKKNKQQDHNIQVQR